MPLDRPTAPARLPDDDAEPEKRRAILHAAVGVFAEKGYHGCRIADVARAAGVAYGLVYHYFRNKEELLESVFDEQWTIFLSALRTVSEGPEPAPAQLAAMCRFAVDVFRRSPSAVRVLLLEVARTPGGLGGGSTRRTFEEALAIVAGVVRRGVAAGELRQVDPAVAAAAFLGALELVMTGMVMGLVGGQSDAEVERAGSGVIDLVLSGLAPR